MAEMLGTAPAAVGEPAVSIVDISDPKTFADAVLDSREFRSYIVNGLTLGSIPPAVLTRIMDLAGWLAAPKRKELSGPNGQPIEVITEVRRTVVRPSEVKSEQVVVH